MMSTLARNQRRALMRTVLTILLLSAVCLSGCNTEVQDKTPLTYNAPNLKSAMEQAEIEPSVSPQPHFEGTPLFQKELPDRSWLRFYHVGRVDGIITVSYEYVPPVGETVFRILQFHEDGASFVVYDDEGYPLAGYSLQEFPDKEYAFSFVTDSALLKIITDEAGAEQLDLELYTVDGSASTEFAGLAEMREARKLLEWERAGGILADTLSPANQNLLQRAHIVESWAEYLPTDVDSDELYYAADMIRSSEFQADIQEELGDGPLNVNWPVVLCTVARTANEICKLLNSTGLVCEIIDALARICDAFVPGIP